MTCLLECGNGTINVDQSRMFWWRWVFDNNSPTMQIEVNVYICQYYKDLKLKAVMSILDTNEHVILSPILWTLCCLTDCNLAAFIKGTQGSPMILLATQCHNLPALVFFLGEWSLNYTSQCHMIPASGDWFDQSRSETTHVTLLKSIDYDNIMLMALSMAFGNLYTLPY